MVAAGRQSHVPSTIMTSIVGLRVKQQIRRDASEERKLQQQEAKRSAAKLAAKKREPSSNARPRPLATDSRSERRENSVRRSATAQ
jgi:hypothetical protein